MNRTDGAPSPYDEERVARLLARAGGPEQMPPEVVDRLDEVLAGLNRERAGSAASGSTPVVALDHGRRTRRRRGPALLLAAAAVVTGGFAVQNLVADDERAVTRTTVEDRADQDGDTLGDAAGGSPEAAAGGGATAGSEPGPEADADAGAMQGRTTADRSLRLVPALGVVELRAATLEDDVLAALRAGRAYDVVPPDGTDAAQPACPVPPLEAGETWSPAEYDGRPAVLVAGPERGAAIDARVLSCGGEPLDEVAVAVP